VGFISPLYKHTFPFISLILYNFPCKNFQYLYYIISVIVKYNTRSKNEIIWGIVKMDAIKKKIIKAIHDISLCTKKEIYETDSLVDDLDMDSLMIFDLAITIEYFLNIRISEKQYTKFICVKDVFDFTDKINAAVCTIDKYSPNDNNEYYKAV
jgi:acyl carrier protein